MSVHAIAAVLGGQIPFGRQVTVQGWVRTRRDSKAGLSFVAVHDGSCFEPLQVALGGEAPHAFAALTHQFRVQRLIAGEAVHRTGDVGGVMGLVLLPAL
jgi:asparaginyl-tRNA synthetase